VLGAFAGAGAAGGLGAVIICAGDPGATGVPGLGGIICPFGGIGRLPGIAAGR